MFKKMLLALAVLLVAAPSMAAEFSGIVKSSPLGAKTVFQFDYRRPSGDFTTAIPSCPSMRITWVRGTTGSALLYGTEPSDDTLGEITSATLIDTFTASETIEVPQTYMFFRLVSGATEDAATPSYAEVTCGMNIGGGGGGVTVVADAADLPGTGDPTLIYRIENATNGSDCDNVGGGTEQADCRWNGTAYEPTSQGTAGLANVADDTSPSLGGDLDPNGNQIIGKLEHAPPVDTTSASSPNHVIQENLIHYSNIDGIKAPVEGEGGGILKTKAVGTEQELVNLSESEAYIQYLTLLAGADTDAVGLQIDVYSTGGAQAEGDEGSQIWRGTISDYWLTAFGTTSANLTSGAGTQTIAVGGLTEAESKLLGENKLAVFTGAQVVVEIADAPPGTINGGVIEDFPTTVWSFDGSATGQGVWTFATGQVASSGVQSTGWCFSAVDADYTDLNGQTTGIWLPIDQVSGDTIRTRWQNQGYNGRTPRGYLAGEGANEGRVAPCAVLGRPTFNAGDYVADSLAFIKGAGFPAVSSSAVFEVGAYPGIRQGGLHALFANKLGTMYDSYGFRPVNLLDGLPISSRYQLGGAVNPVFSGALTALVDGAKHAWLTGVDCQQPGACKSIGEYRYADDPGETFFEQYLAGFQLSSEDWADSADWTVLRAKNDATKNLTLHPTLGWGQGGEEFLRASTVGAVSLPLAGGTMTGPIRSNGDLDFRIDFDNNSSNLFRVYKGAGSLSTDLLLSVDETGFATALGGFTASGGNITAGSVSLANRGAINFIGGNALSGNPGNLYRLLAPLTGSSNLDLYLPNTAGSNGWGIITDGAGVLSWADMASQAELDAKSTASTTDNRLLRADGASGDVQDSAVTVSDTGDVSTPGTITSTAGTDNSTRKLVLQTNTSGLGAPGVGECALGWVGTTLNQHCNGGSLTPVGGGAWDPLAELDGQRAKPYFFTDLVGDYSTGNTGDAGEPGFGSFNYLNQGGTTVVVADDSGLDHPGIVSVLSGASGNSGGAFISATNGIRLGGGEVAEFIFQHKVASGTNTTLRMGFLDTISSTDATDGAYIEVAAGGLAATCKTANNGTRTTSATIATLTVDTWYRARVTLNADASQATCQIWNEAGSSQGSQTNSANIPTGSGRNTAYGVVATNSAGSSVTLVWLDWLAHAHTRTLTR